MICGTVIQLDRFGLLEPAVRQSLEYARSHDLAPLETGRCNVAGDALYFNAIEDRLDALQTRLVKTPAQDMRRIIDSRRQEGQLLTARCILLAALLRRESRGAHYREDYPTADASQARPIEIAYQSGELLARFREG